MGVTLDEFLACPSNPANNRQTRMLADLTLSGCYNQSIMPQAQKEDIMFKSAKTNLAQMAFFSVLKYPEISQYMFEETFKISFSVPFELRNESHSSKYIDRITPQQLEKIKLVNQNDIKLYEFGEKLFLKRFNVIKLQDEDFEEEISEVLNADLE